MAKNQRFSPERNSAQAVLLQKEIYRKEERVLGLPGSPEKPNYQQIIREFKPKFSGVIPAEDKPTNILTHRVSESQSLLPSSMHQRISSDFKAGSQSHISPWISNNKTMENLYRARIGAAIQYKDRYDFNNPSPITWLGKQDHLSESVTQRKNPGSPINQDVSRLFQQLNSKKVLKGMGYAKSNIFIS